MNLKIQSIENEVDNILNGVASTYIQDWLTKSLNKSQLIQKNQNQNYQTIRQNLQEEVFHDQFIRNMQNQSNKLQYQVDIQTKQIENYEKLFKQQLHTAQELGYILGEYQQQFENLNATTKHMFQFQNKQFLNSQEQKYSMQNKIEQLNQIIQQLSNEKQQCQDQAQIIQKLNISHQENLVNSQANEHKYQIAIEMLKTALEQKSNKYIELTEEFTQYLKTNYQQQADQQIISQLQEEIQMLKLESAQKDVMINCIGQDAEQKDQEINDIQLQLEQRKEYIEHLKIELQQSDQYQTKIKSLEQQIIQLKQKSTVSASYNLISDPLDQMSNIAKTEDLAQVMQEQSMQINQLRQYIKSMEIQAKPSDSIDGQDQSQAKVKLHNSSNSLYFERQRSFERISENIKNDLIQLLEIEKQQNVEEPLIHPQIPSAVSILQTRNNSYMLPLLLQSAIQEEATNTAISVNSSGDNVMMQFHQNDDRKSSNLYRTENNHDKMENKNLELIHEQEEVISSKSDHMIKLAPSVDQYYANMSEYDKNDKRQNSVVHVLNDLEISDEFHNKEEYYQQQIKDLENENDSLKRQVLSQNVSNYIDHDKNYEHNSILQNLDSIQAQEPDQKIKQIEDKESQHQQTEQHYDNLDTENMSYESLLQKITLLEEQNSDLQKQLDQIKKETENYKSKYQNNWLTELQEKVTSLSGEYQQLQNEHNQLKKMVGSAVNEQSSFSYKINEQQTHQTLNKQIIEEKQLQVKHLKKLIILIYCSELQLNSIKQNVHYQNNSNFQELIKQSEQILTELVQQEKHVEYNFLAMLFNNPIK